MKLPVGFLRTIWTYMLQTRYGLELLAVKMPNKQDFIFLIRIVLYFFEIMKNLFYFLIISIFILMSSCKQDAKVEVEQTQEAVTFEFSKKITIFDKDKNSADLIVYAHTREALDAHTEDVFTLVTNTKTRIASGNVATEPNNTDLAVDDDNEDERAENFVFVDIVNRKFKKDIKSFSVRSSIEYRGENEDLKASINHYFYAWGADDVVGAEVIYRRETRSKEYLTIKFSKKTSVDNIFWQFLADGTLTSPISNSYWNYCGNTIKWEKFRLKVRVHKFTGCCYTFDHNFLIDTEC